MFHICGLTALTKGKCDCLNVGTYSLEMALFVGEFFRDSTYPMSHLSLFPRLVYTTHAKTQI